VHLLEQLAEEVEALEGRLGRHLFLIGESDLNDPRILRRREVGGYGLDAQWSDDLHHALHAVLTGERSGYYADFGALADLARALQQAFIYDGRHSAFRQRRHGRPPTGLSGHRFLGYLQNHDQVGNRARGERIGQLVGPGRLRIGAALVLTAPFVPLLFQGEEWGASSPFQYFTGHEDPALGEAVREGRRREFAAFGWEPERVPDPQSPETFTRSKLDWSERGRDPHASLLAWYRGLIQLRRATPALVDGRMDRVRTRVGEAGYLLVERGAITVACNLSEVPQRVRVSDGACRVLLSSEPGVAPRQGSVELPPDSVIILGSLE
jgi:maltooligosyltrehalose trehalohydrolase